MPIDQLVYYLGDVVPVYSHTNLNWTGATTLQLTIRRPSGATEVYTGSDVHVSSAAKGIVYVHHTMDEIGQHFVQAYRVTSTDTDYGPVSDFCVHDAEAVDSLGYGLGNPLGDNYGPTNPLSSVSGSINQTVEEDHEAIETTAGEPPGGGGGEGEEGGGGGGGEDINLGQHWWYQPAIDVMADVVAISPQYYDTSSAWQGFCVLIYDIATDEWFGRAYPKTGGFGGWPHSLRWSSNGNIYYWLIEYPDENHFPAEYAAGDYWGKLYVIEPDGTYTYIAVFTGNYNTGPDVDYNDWRLMEVQGDEVVVGTTYYVWDDSVDNFVLRMSHDGGATFPDEKIIPKAAGEYTSWETIRSSDDGVFWLMNAYYTRIWDGFNWIVNDYVQVWKSNAGVTDFTKLVDIDVTAVCSIDTTSFYPGYDISNADGQYQFINLAVVGSKWRPLVSTDFGATFTPINLDAYIATYKPGSTSLLWDGTNGILSARLVSDNSVVPFLRTSDGGSTWAAITNPSTLYYNDLEKDGATWVMTDCAEDYGSSNTQGIIISADSGATWAVKNSPATTIDIITGDIIVPGG